MARSIPRRRDGLQRSFHLERFGSRPACTPRKPATPAPVLPRHTRRQAIRRGTHAGARARRSAMNRRPAFRRSRFLDVGKRDDRCSRASLPAASADPKRQACFSSLFSNVPRESVRICYVITSDRSSEDCSRLWTGIRNFQSDIRQALWSAATAEKAGLTNTAARRR